MAVKKRANRAHRAKASNPNSAAKYAPSPQTEGEGEVGSGPEGPESGGGEVEGQSPGFATVVP